MMIRLLNEEETVEIYGKRMPEDFAKGEIKPLERILELQRSKKYFCYGIFESINGTEAMISYCFLVVSDQKDAVLLDYFAVSKDIRGMGYGSRCFSALKEEIKKKGLGNLVLEVENPRFGRDAADKEIRRRRIAFYMKNGMTLTHLRIFLYDVEYLVMTEDSGQLLQAAEQIYHTYQVLLKPDKLKSRLKISTNIRCIATDLDRTLLDEYGNLPKRTEKAVKALAEKGIRFIIASGRAFDTLPAEIAEIAKTQYAITSNGAVVSENGVCIRQSVIKPEAVKELLEEYARAKERFLINMEVFWQGRAYCGREYYEHPERFGSQRAAEYIHTTRNPVDDIEKFAREHENELESVAFVSTQKEEREKLKQNLIIETKNISITSSIEHLIEITPEGVSKETALQWLLEEKGLEPEECAAFGDADNDADMLSYAGIGIAVENASYLAKNAANYVTKSHKQEGVGIVMEEILQILQKDHEIK